jgi:hypothetical protein
LQEKSPFEKGGFLGDLRTSKGKEFMANAITDDFEPSERNFTPRIREKIYHLRGNS